jgi:peroxiredoxin (alkyl hydroperoxide reductase subunit C)
VIPRTQAPDFTANSVVDGKFDTFTLSNYLGKWMVLFFYPFDFTFVCPTEITSFSDSIDEFRAINAEIAGVSTDSHHTHLAWINTAREDGGVGELKIPLVADISKEISHKYGVLVENPEDEMYGAALRGLFIIDPKGTVRSMLINDDHAGRSTAEVLRLVKAFQWADAHDGEVCPANWQPGDDTISASPKGKIKFFKAHN